MPSPYTTLREHIAALLTEGRDHSRLAGEARRVETYWHVGDAIYTHLKDRAERAEYGQHLIHNLSKDIEIPESTLHDIVLFRRCFAFLSTSRELAWSHYRVLIRLPGVDQRRYYECLASNNRWSVRQLQSHVSADDYARFVDDPLASSSAVDASALRARRGQLYTYRIRPMSEAGGREPRFALDLGFHMRLEVGTAELPDPRAGVIVHSQRTRDQADFRPTRRRATSLFTYVARIDRVIDGDTLVATVDLGFHLRTTQRLRLRGIDTPELRYPAGERAREYVRHTLADVDFVVLGTARTDRYGRYLADVFYLPGEADPHVVAADGVFLNRQLIEEGLAVRYR